MRVLVACEFSGRVRDAFLAAGHDAISCDLLETESPGPHIVGDALQAIRDVKPDLLIAHPPCTYLTNAGVRHLYSIPSPRGVLPKVHGEERWAAMREAARFFAALIMAPVERVAVENPIMHGHGKTAIQTAATAFGYPKVKWDLIQTVQPWMFGHDETKATQLWLRNLPPLEPTDIEAVRIPRSHMTSPGPDRWKVRSRTFTGIAAAMAEQWGNL